MAKLTKKQKEAFSKYDPAKQYGLDEAAGIVKEINGASFDASVHLFIQCDHLHQTLITSIQ